MVGQARRDSGSNGRYASQQLCRGHALLLGGGLLRDEIFSQAAAVACNCSWPFDLRLQESRGGAKANGDPAQYEEFGTPENADRHLRRFSLRLAFLLRGLPLPPDGRICGSKPR